MSYANALAKSGARYSNINRTVAINTSKSGNTEPIINHEKQHAVQDNIARKLSGTQGSLRMFSQPYKGSDGYYRSGLEANANSSAITKYQDQNILDKILKNKGVRGSNIANVKNDISKLADRKTTENIVRGTLRQTRGRDNAINVTPQQGKFLNNIVANLSKSGENQQYHNRPNVDLLSLIKKANNTDI